MNTTRRGFLMGMGALLAAPVIIRVSSLMPVSVPRLEFVTKFGPGQYASFDGVNWFAVTDAFFPAGDGALHTNINYPHVRMQTPAFVIYGGTGLPA